MTAYIIADVDVTDEAVYEEYKTLSGPALAQYGGRFVVRGGNPAPVEGGWETKRIVVCEFPDREAAMRFWDSPEYRKARAVRGPVSVFRSVLVDGA
jgi:uncharacterized protein (DUF1330 family)